MKQCLLLAGLPSAILLTTLVSCGSPGIPLPPSLDLPQPVTDLRATRKGDKVFLAWTVPTQTTDGLTVRQHGTTQICRSLDIAMTDCEKPVGEVPSPVPPTANSTSKTALPAKAQGSYIDQLSASVLSGNSEAQLFYSVSVTNQNGKSAGLSNVVSVPAFLSTNPPKDFRAQVTAEGVILAWARNDSSVQSSGVDRAYRVYRRGEGMNSDTFVGEEPIDSNSDYRLLDRTFDWEKKYVYRATIIARIHLPEKPDVVFEGEDSPVVNVFAHDIFPPAVPAGLQAVFSGVGQQPFIDLIWAPDTDADLAGYNIYRSDESGQRTKINDQLVKTAAYRDTNVYPGHTYTYSVTASDVRGNESAPSAEASETVH